MKLSKFCVEDLISFELQAQAKEEVIRELVDLASKSKLVKDADQLLQDILEREKLVTTGVGYGVAFPHAKSKAIRGIIIAFGRSKRGIDFRSMDKKPIETEKEKIKPSTAPSMHTQSLFLYIDSSLDGRPGQPW